MEDPTGASRTRCGAYRTLYIYSPKLKRDICVHSIKREFWPQYVVFDGMDVKENNGQEYHFQIWLAGASPRQMDARTSVRLTQCQRLLWAMRKDVATANVEIVIKDTTTTTTQSRSEKSAEGDHHGTGCKSKSSESDSQTSASTDKHSERRSRPRENNQSNRRSDNDNNSNGVVVFRAHKCILESIAFFDRMLNSDFREAQADEYGQYTIQLSNEMFDAEIMDHLLDYLYTREPISVEPPPPSSSPGSSSYSSLLHHYRHHSFEPCPGLGPSYDPEVRHVLSANVSLNLETIITETRYPPGLHRHRSHHQCLLPTTGLTLWHWGAMYRASLHLEDKELQTTTLQQIQAHLDPETTLEQVLKWGHQHEEVKAVMLEYLIKERREVFGDEQRNKLRPYLWAEFEEQVETLVEITSQIARQ
ncbi:hypothetical protein BGZ58_005592 [Dissophora ornata]|nr:hypothetical protein BGZ58_005592 [Dissophora ornata]